MTTASTAPGDDAAAPARRWAGRERFVMLLTGAAAAPELLDAWRGWRDRRGDPRRCARLWLIWIVPDPAAALLVLSVLAGQSRPAAERELAERLLAAWPPPTPNLHQFALDYGDDPRVLLAPGAVAHWLMELRSPVDAFVLHAWPINTSPRRVFKALARLCAPGATLSGSALDQAAADAQRLAGFVVPVEAAATATAPAPAPAPATVTATAAHGPLRLLYAPAFEPRRPTIPRQPNPARRTIVVGAGLAGCATAWALAEAGIDCSVLERHDAIAAEASGNPGGLFHGIVNAQDGAHARFNRAAALQAQQAVQIATRRHGVAGGVSGLLRLETAMNHARMTAVLGRLGLPESYVRAVDVAEAGQLAGAALPHPAWFYPGGGWVEPAGLARACLERAGTRASLRCGVEVHRLRRSGGGSWQLFAADGGLVDEAATVVLANAGDALRLLGDLGSPGWPDWPIDAVRGQLSWIDASAASRFDRYRLPIAGSGYLLDAGGRVVFGATAQLADPDAAVRVDDHRLNLAQLARLTGRVVPFGPESLQGRTAWRWVARDRLPLIGAVPDPAAFASNPRQDQVRFVPRLAGLHVFTALGSRGITWAALGARVLASQIGDAPAPLEASLCDAIDPARFGVRRARHQAAPLLPAPDIAGW